jgi:hypothetical protein
MALMFCFYDALITKFPALCGKINAGWQAHFKSPVIRRFMGQIGQNSDKLKEIRQNFDKPRKNFDRFKHNLDQF